VKFLGKKVPCTLGDLILRLLYCIVTILFVVYLALRLFELALYCVGECMCGCFDNCVGVGVLVICVLVFTVLRIVCTVFLYCFFYVYIFLFVLSVLV